MVLLCTRHDRTRCFDDRTAARQYFRPRRTGSSIFGVPKQIFEISTTLELPATKNPPMYSYEAVRICRQVGGNKSP